MFNMALHYRDGAGVGADLSRCYEWAMAAAKLCFAPAQHLVRRKESVKKE